MTGNKAREYKMHKVDWTSLIIVLNQHLLYLIAKLLCVFLLLMVDTWTLKQNPVIPSV